MRADGAVCGGESAVRVHAGGCTSHASVPHMTLFGVVTRVYVYLRRSMPIYTQTKRRACTLCTSTQYSRAPPRRWTPPRGERGNFKFRARACVERCVPADRRGVSVGRSHGTMHSRHQSQHCTMASSIDEPWSRCGHFDRRFLVSMHVRARQTNTGEHNGILGWRDDLRVTRRGLRICLRLFCARCTRRVDIKSARDSVAFRRRAAHGSCRLVRPLHARSHKR